MKKIKYKLPKLKPGKRARLAGKSQAEIERAVEEENSFNIEMLKIANHFFPELMEKLKAVEDGRYMSYTKYNGITMILSRLFISLMSCHSMREGGDALNNTNVIKLLELFGGQELDNAPCDDAINDYLAKCSPSDLQAVVLYMVKTLIKNKVVAKYRIDGKYYQFVLDGTKFQDLKGKSTKESLQRVHSRGTDKEKIENYCYVMEIKLVFGEYAISVMSEFVENKSEYAKLSDSMVKQDCEIEAIKRSLPKLRALFPELNIVLTGDSLMNCDKFYGLAEFRNFKYILRFKKGSIPQIEDSYKERASQGFAEQFSLIEDDPQAEGDDPENKPKIKYDYSFANGICYNSHELSYIRMDARSVIGNNEGRATTYIFVTNLNATKDRVAGLVEFGRKRWRIENRGFKEQKRGGLYLEHVFSYKNKAMKCHYFLIQIAHTIRQLFEMGWSELEYLKGRSDRSIRNTVKEHFRYRPVTEEWLNAELSERLYIKFAPQAPITDMKPTKPSRLDKPKIKKNNGKKAS
ncbi:MAG: transposase [Clostridiales bacterium]|nr:transposase [Clostridiales bacterium]